MRHKTELVCGLAAGSRGQTMTEYATDTRTVAVIATALVQSAGTILTSWSATWCALFSVGWGRAGSGVSLGAQPW